MVFSFREPYEQQKKFLTAENRFVAYGGARGGGKSWAARLKAVLLALNHAGIQILLLRRTLSELRENHIVPLRQMLKCDVATERLAKYREKTKEFIFPNGSRIVLGYMASETDVLQYQGQSYDVIFMEEATQFTEFQFQSLTECNRSSGLCKEKFYPRMYFTCNPGGVGHYWVKRLFIDKRFTNSERPEDYTFIQATVYDNSFLLNNSPDYVRNLENLPENRRKAMLYGDWDVFDGQYFEEFNPDIHVVNYFEIPDGWKRYISIDYGLDMLAALWIAVDFSGNAYVYKEICQPNRIISEAAELIKINSEGENINMRYAPPDMWNRRQETGKSAAEIFNENGVYFYKSDNNRVQGWYNLKEWLCPYMGKDGKMTARLKIFSNCKNLIHCLPLLQHDDTNPNDVAKQPHDITHAPDALRGFIAGRPAKPHTKTEKEKELAELEDEKQRSFLNFGT